MTTSEPTFIVGIGGSAGGLYAYTALLDALSPGTGMAFVILSHVLPTASEQLSQLLRVHTQMPVLVAADGMPIKSDHVYINPPNADVRIENNAFNIVSPRSVSNRQVDFFLVSLAEAIGARAIGVILSGYDGDGTIGCKMIKAMGGKTFAQDTTAYVGAMPKSAQTAGCIDFVLPPERIAVELKKLAGRSHVSAS